MIPNIPNLPTDNLYKFKSVSGLIVTIFSLYATLFILYQVALSQNASIIIMENMIKETKRDSLPFQVSINRIIADSKIAKFKNTISEIKNKATVNTKDSFDFMLRQIKKTLLLDSIDRLYYLELDSLLSVDERKLYERHQIMGSLDSIRFKNGILVLFSILSLVLFLLSFRFTNRSFSDWYEKHQKYQDLIIKFEAESKIIDEKI